MKKILFPHSIMDRSDSKKSYREGHNITDSEKVGNMIIPKEATVFLYFHFQQYHISNMGYRAKENLKCRTHDMLQKNLGRSQ